MIDIDFASLRRIGLTQAIAHQLQLLDLQDSAARLVRVTEVHRDAAIVHDGATQLRARSLPGDEGLAVGDWILVSPQAGDEFWLSARLEPLTHLARRTADGRRQPLASNIDTALLVMGLDHDFNLRRIERYLALVHAAGVAPVVVLTKADIAANADERLDQLRSRLPGNVPMFAVNGLGNDAPVALAPWLGMGQTLILLGSSGAGKSTLTNTLTGGAQATGGVREDDSRGRHTTTARSLHLCEGGACIIDTPGLRSLQPDIDEEELTAAFEDIDALAGQCQFRDCRHEAEPGCAVRAVVDPDRVRNYHKLLREARRGQQTQLDRIAERSKFKVLVKAVGARNRAKKAGMG
jgi:ribosome biogenesis GTPase